MRHSLGARGILILLGFQRRGWVGCRVISRVMEEFSEFIVNHYLIDLLLTGAYFTWSRSGESSPKSRLCDSSFFTEVDLRPFTHLLDGSRWSKGKITVQI